MGQPRSFSAEERTLDLFGAHDNGEPFYEDDGRHCFADLLDDG
jgi:hypothetical protein